MSAARDVKILVLDLPNVIDPTIETVRELRTLVCDGWLYGFKDGSRFNEGEHYKMQAYINATVKKLRIR